MHVFASYTYFTITSATHSFNCRCFNTFPWKQDLNGKCLLHAPHILPLYDKPAPLKFIGRIQETSKCSLGKMTSSKKKHLAFHGTAKQNPGYHCQKKMHWQRTTEHTLKARLHGLRVVERRGILGSNCKESLKVWDFSVGSN